MSEKGHNWLLLYPNKDKAIEYLKNFCSNTTAFYACGYTITIEGIDQYEILIEHSTLCSKEQLKTRSEIVIKQYGTRYSVFKKCVNIDTIFYEYGTRPTEQQNTMDNVISSFMNNEGDMESMYYKRYKTYLDSIRSKYSPLEGKVQLFGTSLIEKNILIYGGSEKKRNEYIEEITRGHNVYNKKTDKYWYKYQHEEFVIIKEISQLSFKKIISNLLIWSGSEEYEAEIYHNKIKMYPKDYRLIVSLKFDPNTLKKVSEEEKLLLTRFKIIELEKDEIEEENYERENEQNSKENEINKDITEIINSIDTNKAITENKPFTKKSTLKENNKESKKESKKVKLSKSDTKKKEKKETKKSREKPKDTKKKINTEDTNNKDNNTITKEEMNNNNNNNTLLLRKSTPYEDTVSLETYQRIQNDLPIKRTNSPTIGNTFNLNSFTDIMIGEDTSNDETNKINLDTITMEDIIVQEKPKEHKHKSNHSSKENHNKEHLKEHKHTKEHHHHKKEKLENKRKEITKPKKCTTTEKLYNEFENKKYRINLLDEF